MDLFILEEYRQQGLGKGLMDYIINYPELKKVKRIKLATKDAHGLYEKYGFKFIEYADKILDFVQDNN